MHVYKTNFVLDMLKKQKFIKKVVTYSVNAALHLFNISGTPPELIAYIFYVCAVGSLELICLCLWLTACVLSNKPHHLPVCLIACMTTQPELQNDALEKPRVKTHTIFGICYQAV